jgi:hypothetical protein
MKKRVLLLESAGLLILLSGCAETELLPEPEDAAVAIDATTSSPSDAEIISLDAGPLEDAGTPDATEPVLLAAEAGPAQYALLGVEVTLDGRASTGAHSYQWNFGNGDSWPEPRPEALATVTYREPGRYSAVLTVFGPGGARRADAVVISVTHPPVHVPNYSSTIVPIPGTGQFAVVSPDSNELTIVELRDETLSLVSRTAVSASPRTVAATPEYLAVACDTSDTVEILTRERQHRIELAPGSRPYGILAGGNGLWVTLQGRGELAEIPLDSGGNPRGAPIYHPAIRDARGLAFLPGQRLAVTRWRSPDSGGEIAILDLGTAVPRIGSLAVDPQLSSDTEIGGVPSYLDQILISPTGLEAAVPSLQANIADGLYKNGRNPIHDTTVRAVVSFFDVLTERENFELREQFDDRGYAAGGVFTSRGDYLFVSMPGSRAVERFDMLNRAQSGTVLDLGYAPRGLALSADDNYLVAEVYLSRELVLYDVSNFRDLPQPLSRVNIPSAEPLAPDILRGKQLFNDTLDTRITSSGYIACAHCHLDGDSDNRVWDFTDRGEGLRNTISLLGREGTKHGPIHWSGNFDEIHDFENDIRNSFAGTGLIDDVIYSVGTRNDPLGDPKAGLSSDLDALAAYVTSLANFPKSPVATSTRGRELFEASGCANCHAGENMTDSQFLDPGAPLLHDVGTISAGSGLRRGQTLLGLDTPTLRGLHSSAPYLHDGSAATLHEVLDRNREQTHGTTAQLTSSDAAELVQYLLSL